MRHLKMLGLAVIAAMGLMAFLGAGTASATTLCEEKEGLNCYSAGTAMDWSPAKGTTAKTTDTSGKVVGTCTKVTLSGKTKETSATKLLVGIESILWEGCTQTTDTIATGELGFEWTEGSNAAMTGSGTEITSIITGVTCTYGDTTGTSFGTAVGGEQGEVNVSAVFTKTAGSFICPPTTVMDVQLVTTKPQRWWWPWK